MVKLRTFEHQDKNLDPDQWLTTLAQSRPDHELQFLRTILTELSAYNQEALPGVSCLHLGIVTGDILHHLQLDVHTIAAGIIYPFLPHLNLDLEFLKPVQKLLQGVQRMDAIRIVRTHKHPHQLNNLRKMLLAMVDDVRVVLIKLAERTAYMEHLGCLPTEKQQQVAQETFDIYAPLANRLGIGQIKWILEDLAFRYLHPDTYKEITGLLDQKRKMREEYLERMVHILKEALPPLQFTISGRAKHIYSIYRKLHRKGGDFHKLYDLIALRIIVGSIEDCYTALGVVHALFHPIPEEFDDYIARPKPNGYRSIHTALIGPDQHKFEVQIRTKDMHEEAELGVAAHWIYKEGTKPLSQDEKKIAWLRQVIDWHKELTHQEGLESLESSLLEDTIYSFTPHYEVIALARGSTPLDFAYAIHTDVGHRCRGAKVNGSIVPLTYQLKTGDQVEILTGKQQNPSRDWINPALGYIHTQRARSKVQHWFKIEDDRHKEEHAHVELPQPPPQPEVEPEVFLSKPKREIQSGIQIQGIGNLLNQMANCCHPVPGDSIIGFITKGRGVTIHRQNCANLQQLVRTQKERLIAVDWGTSKGLFSVDIYIESLDRQGLIRDITSIISNDKINLTALNTITDRHDQHAKMVLTVEVPNLEVLEHTMEQLKQLPEILVVERVKSGGGQQGK